MKTNQLRYVLLSLIILLSACTRKSDSSSMRIVLPGVPNHINKSSVGSLGVSPFCYYVNVTGPGITQIDSLCAPAQGISSGFVEPSTTVELKILKGITRTVELFGYIPTSGESCSSLGNSLAKVPVNRLFRLDHKSGIDMMADENTVDLTANFPGLTQHFGIQAPLSASCYASLPDVNNLVGSTNPARIQMSADTHAAWQTGFSEGTGVKLIGRVGSFLPHNVHQSADGTKLVVK